MKARALVLVFACVAAFALVAMAPLSLVAGGLRLAQMGFAAQAVEGTIWAGVLRGLSFRGDQIGDVRVRVAPLGLLVGRAGLRFRVAGQVEGGGVLQLGHRAAGLLDAELSMPSRLLAPRAPFDGEVALHDFTALFQDGRCRKAGGQARLEISRIAGAPMQGLSLAGEAACQDGVLVVPLSGTAQGARVEATLHIDGSGRYRLDSRVMTTDSGLGLALGMAAFERTLEGARRTDQGRIAEHADR
jgi:Bacterial type II secretion system protein N.